MAEKSFYSAHRNPMNGMQTDLHFNSWNDEMIVHSYQTKKTVDRILDYNAAVRDMQPRNDRVRFIGSIPAMVYDLWKREFAKGQHSFADFDKFLEAKINSREFEYLRLTTGKV